MFQSQKYSISKDITMDNLKIYLHNLNNCHLKFLPGLCFHASSSVS
jgi:hypothetical protein